MEDGERNSCFVGNFNLCGTPTKMPLTRWDGSLYYISLIDTEVKGGTL